MSQSPSHDSDPNPVRSSLFGRRNKRRGIHGESTGRKTRSHRKSRRSRLARFERLDERIVLASWINLIDNIVENPGAEGKLVTGNDSPWARLGYASSMWASGREGTSGQRMFFGGTTATAYMFQTQYFDSSLFDKIYGGIVYADLSAYLGGWQNQNDRADVEISWFNASGQELSNGQTLRGPGASERGNRTSLLYGKLTNIKVPADARSVEIRIGFHRSAGDDNDGYADEITLAFKEKNIAPYLLMKPSYSVNEGATVKLSVTAGDQNGEDLSYAWDFDGDGKFNDGNNATATFSAVGLDGKSNSSRTVRVRVSDGTFNTDASTTVSIVNVAPTISKVTAINLLEGSPATISVTASDPGGSLDPLTYQFDMDGNGTYEFSNSTGKLDYAFPDDGTYTFKVRVRDDELLYSQEKLTTVNVANVAPSISNITNSGPILENSPVSIDVTATDPAGAGDPLTYSFDFDNDGQYEYSSALASMTHVFPDDGIFKVNVLVEDPDGGSRTSYTNVTVQNAAPDISSIENTGPIPQGTPLVITVTASDQAGVLDPLTYLFDLDGDGEFETSNATGRIAHVFFDAGTHRVGIGVQDDDSGLTVSYSDVQVLSITPPEDLPEDAPRVSFDTGYRSVREEAVELSLTARLNKPSDSDVVIPISFGGTATKDEDYTSLTSITIPTGELSASIPLSILDDPDAESSETIIVRLLPPSNAVISSHPADPIVQTIVIQANDAPSVTLTSAYQEIAESGGQLTLRARLSSASSEVIEAPFSVTGTATPGVDYDLPVTSFVFQPGELEAVAILTVLNDNPALFEPTEQILVRIASPRVEHADGSTSPILLGSTSSSAIVIRDDDLPKLTLQAQNPVYENAGLVVLTAQLSLPSISETPVRITAADYTAKLGSDFSLANGASEETIVIPAGFTSASTILHILNDAISEDRESFYLTAIAEEVENPKQPLRVDILDDEPFVSLENASVQLVDTCGVNWCVYVPFGEGGSRDITLKVKLSSATTYAVTVPIQLTGDAKPGRDYEVLDDTFVVIPPGQTEELVRLRIIDNAIAEKSKTVVATLGTVTNGNRNAKSSTLSFDILDDDDTYLSFSGSSQTVSEHVGTSYVMVRLSQPSENPTPFSLSRISTSTADSHDYSLPSPEKMVIPAGQTRVVIGIDITPDKLVEKSETIDFRLTTAGETLIDLGLSSYTITIRDDDKPTTTYLNPSALNINTRQSGSNEELEDATTSGPGEIASSSSGTSTSSGAQTNNQVGSIYASEASQLADGTLYFDANKNLVLDPDEYEVTTALDGSAFVELPMRFDTNGDGIIDATEGQWVLAGSFDPATGLALSGALTGPVGSYVVSPLTTLMTGLVEHQLSAGQIADIPNASQRVTDALGLPSIPLMQLDATNQVNSGNIEAAAIYRAQAMVYDTVKQIAAFAAGLLGAPPRAALETIVFADITDKIQEPGSTLDLSNQDVIRSIIEGTLQATGLSAGDELLDGASNVIAANNQQLDLISPAGDRTFLESVARVKKLAQGSVATDLMLASVGQQTILSVVSNWTGLELEQRITTTTIGNVVAPELWVGDSRIVEGDSGESWAEFDVFLMNDTVVPVSVQFTTLDGNATVDSGDYSASSGSLLWNPGDPSVQTVRVAVTSDTVFESDEYFLLLLDEPQNAVIRRHLGTGLIENDDALNFSVPADGIDNDYIIELLDTNIIISRNGVILLGAAVASAPITITGTEGVANRFTMVVGNDASLPAGGLTLVGDGDDTIEIQSDSLSDAVVYDMTDSSSGQISIDDSALQFRGITQVRDGVTAYQRTFLFSGTGSQSIELGDDGELDSGSSQLRSEEAGQLFTVDFAIPWQSLTVQTAPMQIRLLSMSWTSSSTHP